MTFPESIRSALSSVAKGLKLVASEQDKLRSEKARFNKTLTEAYDRKVSLENEVRTLEARLLKLDRKRDDEHGVLRRATDREMQLSAVQLKAAEKNLHGVLDQIGELDLYVGQIDKLLTGQPLAAEDWDGVGLAREEQIALANEARKARSQVEELTDPEPVDLEDKVDVADVLDEIRGGNTKRDAATEDVLREVRERRAKAESETH